MDDASTLSNTTLLAAELESFLPQLPGYRPRRTQPGPKPQKLGFREGIRVLADEAPGQPDLSDLKSTGGLTSTFNSSSVGAPTVKARGAASRTLVFNGYFKETVQESNLENQRVRKLRITHHLEDSTTSMNELKADNSGLPEGKFLQRHPVVNDETGEVLAPEDLAVGRVVGVYGRALHVINADGATRAWFQDELGMELQDDLGWPDDDYTTMRRYIKAHETGADPDVRHNRTKSRTQEFAEAMLGNTLDLKTRGSFEEHARTVLRFDCAWDDRSSLYGDVHRLTIHYFLADDTIEVVMVHGANSGRDPFPRLVKRCKLLKDSSCIALIDPTQREASSARAGHYHWTDLFVGATVNVHGRTLHVVDADPSTRAFYRSHGAEMEGDGAPPDQEELPQFERVLPPYNGFGTEEDSLTSCQGSLIQQQPRKVLKKDLVLRFTAKFKKPVPEDELREFVVQYFHEDGSVAIREPPVRNSGVMGGTFLSRMRLKDGAGRPISYTNFAVGKEIVLSGHRLVLLATDKATEEALEALGKEAARARIGNTSGYQ